MRILFLSFYFEPDLSAGSFRNTPLFRELLSQISSNDWIHVVTTMPNRYHSYHVEVQESETGVNYRIDRVKLPKHKNGFADQIRAFSTYYREVMRIVKDEEFDLVYASSGRLFTAYLGRKIAADKKAKIFLDIRDIFVDTIKDVFKHKPYIQIPLVFVLKRIEHYTFSKVDHVNLVSEGFVDYFSKYKKASFSYLTNGIDNVFLKIDRFKHPTNDVRIITYAGNIGSGQGLEKVVPQAAKLLGRNFLFRIIGDGGTKQLLLNKIEELKIENVEVINPVSRNELLEYYKKTDFLFLHLNDLDAFKKVLPSKMFEYAVFPFPIIAGVGGYAQTFIKTNIDNCILFDPTDYISMVNQIKNFKYEIKSRDEFVNRYSRGIISQELAKRILSFRGTENIIG